MCFIFYPMLIYYLFWSFNIEGSRETRVDNIQRTYTKMHMVENDKCWELQLFYSEKKIYEIFTMWGHRINKLFFLCLRTLQPGKKETQVHI